METAIQTFPTGYKVHLLALQRPINFHTSSCLVNLSVKMTSCIFKMSYVQGIRVSSFLDFPLVAWKPHSEDRRRGSHCDPQTLLLMQQQITSSSTVLFLATPVQQKNTLHLFIRWTSLPAWFVSTEWSRLLELNNLVWVSHCTSPQPFLDCGTNQGNSVCESFDVLSSTCHNRRVCLLNMPTWRKSLSNIPS